MTLSRTVGLSATCLLVVVALGCGDRRYVPVSGVVKLNGVPYKNGVVSFQPIATKGNTDPGRGSSAYTDENGRFTLKTDDGRVGAVVGKHRVRIMTRFESLTGKIDPEVGSPDGDPRAFTKVPTDPIPPEWNALSTKEFDVPAGGTTTADFDIATKSPGKK